MKKLYVCFLLIFSFSIIFVTQVSARSLSIDKVDIKSTILPNGDLLMKEAFTYTFKGNYHVVRRSVHSGHHNGIFQFQAYELLNSDATLETMTQEDLSQLEVSLENNRYFATLPVKDEKKTIVYSYTLKNAIKSYNSYSDLIIPFFAENKNHDIDLHNVTIDIIFPEKLDPNTYHAFFHDEKGEVIRKGEDFVRFSTPVSRMYRLTEIRLLFPSSIMYEQQKLPDPAPLKETLDLEEASVPKEIISEEEDIAKAYTTQRKMRNSFERMLPIFSVALGVLAILLLLLPQRLVRSKTTSEKLLNYDPLYLYMIDREGTKDSYAFFAGLYSLVEKGYVSVKKIPTSRRIQNDPEAPKNTLSFIFHPYKVKLAEDEKYLVDWLFIGKLKQGNRLFSLNNIYGRTKREKKNNDFSYREELNIFHKDESIWFNNLIDKMTQTKMLGGKLYLIIGRMFMIIATLSVIAGYYTHSGSGFWLIMYLIFAPFLIHEAWVRKSRKRILTYFFLSIFAGWLVVDSVVFPEISLFIITLAIVFFFTPRYILSKEAREVKAEIRHFKAVLSSEGVPSDVSGAELEKWVTRAILLDARKLSQHATHLSIVEMDNSLHQPLTDLFISGEEPTSYLIKTWKSSEPSLTSQFFDALNTRTN